LGACAITVLSDVDRTPAGLPHRRQRARQQHHGVGAGELGGGVGEVTADVAQAGGAEQRVGDGVRQRVGIRMAQQAVAVRDAHAAEDQRAAFDETVHVPALADAQVDVHGRFLSRVSASAKSSGSVTLKFSSGARTSRGLQTQRLDGAGLVGNGKAGLPRRVERAQQAEAKHLRRLRGPQAVARHGRLERALRRA
jgi:hypothetical protein